MTIQKILLASNATVNAALQQIAKILTDTEGQETTDKKDEIFEILLNIKPLKDELRAFTRLRNVNNATILNNWIRTRSVIDVIDLKHGQADWCFVLKVSRIPIAIYNNIKPKDALQVAATSTQQTFKEKTIYVYGDSRIGTNTDNGEPDKVNVIFFMAYKAGVVPQGM